MFIRNIRYMTIFNFVNYFAVLRWYCMFIVILEEISYHTGNSYIYMKCRSGWAELVVHFHNTCTSASTDWGISRN